ncbi:hypothetical protein AB1Y20_018692 [Prymnesium parvum]|uniref:Uncharacterized protein n=1 Tax=Prymnesium parvum TaxID=97485 RepID=A0AB34JRZ0_PRYPA
MESDKNMTNDKVASSQEATTTTRQLGKTSKQRDDVKDNKEFKTDTTDEPMENKVDEQTVSRMSDLHKACGLVA